MAKQLLFESDARDALRRGVEKLAKAVTSTLGPRGRNAILDKGWGAPTITKDGVSVAEEIELGNPYEQLGAQLVREVASKTSDVAGDGTTTATLLTEAIFVRGLRALTAGASPARLAAALRDGTKAVTEALDKASKKVSTSNEIAQVATISANNDARIGKLIAGAMDKVGKDGVITVEEGKTLETDITVVEGMQFDRGFLSAHFVNDPESMECTYEKPLILVHEGKLSNVQQLLPLLEAIKDAKRPLLIIAEDVESEALATLVVNKLRGIVNVCAVKAPGYGDRRKSMLVDIATLTGATALMKDLGMELERVTLRDLGTARKVVVSADDTTIVGGAGKKAEIEGRIAQIRAEIEKTTSDYDREKLQERLAKLTGGIAQINVGGATETEVKERKALIEDALHATRAAVEQGILPGGGVALLRAREVLAKLEKKDDQDYAIGLDILRDALLRPAATIADNAGHDGAVVAHRILRERSRSYGFDALRGEYGDLIELGIVDPTKVTKAALHNAVSVATLLLTTDALITTKKEPVKAGGPGMEGMDGMDGMGGMGGMD
ncbi:MAG TPA: chaperonin GroEL, partial [Planctomycetota bacterium]|nr:chaperonin GroEL [Planctomycetota bacterium]